MQPDHADQPTQTYVVHADTWNGAERPADYMTDASLHTDTYPHRL